MSSLIDYMKPNVNSDENCIKKSKSSTNLNYTNSNLKVLNHHTATSKKAKLLNKHFIESRREHSQVVVDEQRRVLLVENNNINNTTTNSTSTNTAISNTKISKEDLVETNLVEAQTPPSPLPSPVSFNHSISTSSSVNTTIASPTLRNSTSNASCLVKLAPSDSNVVHTTTTANTPPQSPFMIIDDKRPISVTKIPTYINVKFNNTDNTTNINESLIDTSDSALNNNNNDDLIMVHTPSETNDEEVIIQTLAVSDTNASAEKLRKITNDDDCCRLNILLNAHEQSVEKLTRLKKLNNGFALKKQELNKKFLKAGERLRKFEINCFNQNIINYISDTCINSNTSSRTREKNELLVYEQKRRQEEKIEDDSDATEFSDSDLDDQDINDGEMIYELPIDDFLIEPGVNTKKSSTQSIQTEDSDLNNSELSWFKNRLKLGSEWQRVQTKLKYLKFKNEQLNQYTSSQLEIQKLSNSLKESLNQTFKTANQENIISESMPVTISGDNVNDFKSSISLGIGDNENTRNITESSISYNTSHTSNGVNSNDDSHKSSRCDFIYNRNKPKNLRRFTRVNSNINSMPFSLKKSTTEAPSGKSLNEYVKFDDLLLKAFYLTLIHFRTSLFKRACFCDEFNNNNSLNFINPIGNNNCFLTNKTCIFCNFFKKYEDQLSGNLKESFLSKNNGAGTDNNSQINDGKNGLKCDQSGQSSLSDDSARADERLIKFFHSYSKQPLINKTNRELAVNNSFIKEKLNLSSSSLSNINKKKREVIDELSKDMTSRNHLCDSGDMIKKIKIDGDTSTKIEHDIVESFGENSKSLELDEIEIDPGFEITLEDIKKLPDFSYEELKFLCGDLSDSENEKITTLSTTINKSRKRSNRNMIDTNDDRLINTIDESEEYDELEKATTNTTTEISSFIQLNKRIRVSNNREKEMESIDECEQNGNQIRKNYPNGLSQTNGQSRDCKNNIISYNNKKINNKYTHSRKLFKKNSQVINLDEKSNIKRDSKRSNSTSGEIDTNGYTCDNYFLNNSWPRSNKYNINDVIMPINDKIKITENLIRVSNVPTPSWREIEYSGDAENQCGVNSSLNTKNIIQHESIDDITYIKRHKLAELREKYYAVFKRLDGDEKSNHSERQNSGIRQTKLYALRQLFNYDDSFDVQEFEEIVSKFEAENNLISNNQFNWKFQRSNTGSNNSKFEHIQNRLDIEETPTIFCFNSNILSNQDSTDNLDQITEKVLITSVKSAHQQEFVNRSLTNEKVETTYEK